MAREYARRSVCAANMRGLCAAAHIYESDFDGWLASRSSTNTHAARLSAGAGHLGEGAAAAARCPGGDGQTQALTGYPLGRIVYGGGGRLPDPDHEEDYWNYCGVWCGGSADAGKCLITPRHHEVLHEPMRARHIADQWGWRYVMFYDIITVRAFGNAAFSQDFAYWRANHQLRSVPTGSNVGLRDGSVAWRPFDAEENLEWGWNWITYAASGDWRNYGGFFFSQGTSVNGWTVIPSETISMCQNMSYYWRVKSTNSHMYSATYINPPWLNK